MFSDDTFGDYNGVNNLEVPEQPRIAEWIVDCDARVFLDEYSLKIEYTHFFDNLGFWEVTRIPGKVLPNDSPAV